jgi:mRNA interferase MazF
MEEPVTGDVVVVPFPFSDLSTMKRRPALVLAAVRDDLILCQITSKSLDAFAVPLVPMDFASGGLQQESSIRTSKLFTADKGIVLYTVGAICSEKRREVLLSLHQLFPF